MGYGLGRRRPLPYDTSEILMADLDHENGLANWPDRRMQSLPSRSLLPQRPLELRLLDPLQQGLDIVWQGLLESNLHKVA